MRKTLIVALLLGLAPMAHAAQPTLYDKVAARLKADPALAAALGKPGAEIRSAAWLLGSWDVVATVQAGAKPRAPEHGTSTVTAAMNGTWLEIRDRYPSGTQDVGFLGYSPATKRWTSVSLDSTGNAVTLAGGWNDKGLVLEGDVVIVGVAVHLRQTVARQGVGAYTVTNEERGADGHWRVLDTYRYTRR